MGKKIGIDIRHYYRKRGISSYIKNIIFELNKRKNSDLEFYLVSDRNLPVEFKEIDLKSIVFPIPIYPIWDLFIPIVIKFYKLNIFHSMGNSTPFFKPKDVKYITTIHDLIFYNTEFNGNTLYQKVGRSYLKFNLYQTIKNIDHIVAVSNHTKKEIINAFKEDPNKIIVTYQGCKEIFNLKKKPEYTQLNEFLAFGSLDKRKNTKRLIKAFDVIFDIKSDYKLNMVGLSKGEFLNIIKGYDLKNERNFIFHKNVSEQFLVDLYKSSIGLIYPSLSEGFGLPIIESANCKTPVITSNVTSTAEIAGEDAILVNPRSTDEIILAIKKLFNVLIFNKYQKKCISIKKRFTWEQIVNNLIRIYNIK